MPDLTIEQAVAEVINKITGDAVNVISSSNISADMVSTPITWSTNNKIDFGTCDNPSIRYPWSTSPSYLSNFTRVRMENIPSGSTSSTKQLLSDATIINRASGILSFSNWGKVFRPICDIIVQNVVDVYYIQPSLTFIKLVQDGTDYYYDQQAIVVEYVSKTDKFLHYKIAEGSWSGSKFIVTLIRDAQSTDLLLLDEAMRFYPLGAYTYGGAGRTIFSEDVTTTSITVKGRTTDNIPDKYPYDINTSFTGRYLWIGDFADRTYLEFVVHGSTTHSNIRTFVLGVAHCGNKYNGTSRDRKSVV